jgi:hypothetical protein
MTSHESDVVQRWVAKLRPFVPEFVGQHAVLSKFAGRMAIALHGSTTMGIDDPFSDLDFWLLLPAGALAEFDALSPTRFISFQLDGKEGHFNATGADEFAEQVARCHMDTIYQLRLVVIFADDGGVARRLQVLARQPMPKAVGDAMFFWHYTEMRGEHRACDNPMQRVDPAALLLSLTKTIAHALQAAMVLDGQPYPYDKWLCQAARQTPTGALVAASVDKILALIGQGQLGFVGGEAQHPIGLELRVIRKTLIDAAHAGGINELYLEKWWLCMDQARDAFRNVRWQHATQSV